MKQLISEHYKSLLEYEHSNSQWGNAGLGSVPLIVEYCNKHGYRDILDYGSGYGQTADTLRRGGYNVAEYEPGIPSKAKLPQAHDIVICTDVMEHIELEYLDNVLEHIRSCTKKKAYFSIACYPAFRKLKDGTNAHLIVEDGKWWFDQVSKYFDIEEWGGCKKLLKDWPYHPAPTLNLWASPRF